MNELSQYIKADYAVLVLVLYCIGTGLRALGRFANQYIPLALTACGIVLAGLWTAANYGQYANLAAAIFESVVQGVLCTGMAVYLYEIKKQSSKGSADKEKSDNPSDKP